MMHANRFKPKHVFVKPGRLVISPTNEIKYIAKDHEDGHDSGHNIQNQISVNVKLCSVRTSIFIVTKVSNGWVTCKEHHYVQDT